jgi:hypothetical protein
MSGLCDFEFTKSFKGCQAVLRKILEKVKNLYFACANCADYVQLMSKV